MALRFWVILISLQVAVPAFSQAQDTGNEAIQYVAEQLMVGSRVELLNRNLASAHIIPELYSRREFEPAWNDDEQVGIWIRFVGRAEEEGLDQVIAIATEAFCQQYVE